MKPGLILDKSLAFTTAATCDAGSGKEFSGISRGKVLLSCQLLRVFTSLQLSTETRVAQELGLVLFHRCTPFTRQFDFHDELTKGRQFHGRFIISRRRITSLILIAHRSLPIRWPEFQSQSASAKLSALEGRPLGQSPRLMTRHEEKNTRHLHLAPPLGQRSRC